MFKQVPDYRFEISFVDKRARDNEGQLYFNRHIFLMVLNICAINRNRFILPLGGNGRICSVIMALSVHFLY